MKNKRKQTPEQKKKQGGNGERKSIGEKNTSFQTQITLGSQIQDNTLRCDVTGTVPLLLVRQVPAQEALGAPGDSVLMGGSSTHTNTQTSLMIQSCCLCFPEDVGQDAAIPKQASPSPFGGGSEQMRLSCFPCLWQICTVSRACCAWLFSSYQKKDVAKLFRVQMNPYPICCYLYLYPLRTPSRPGYGAGPCYFQLLFCS